MEKNTQHPVAWVWQFEDGEFYETPHHTKDECERDCCGYDGMAVPLYAAQPPAVAVPDGYVLVPTEPTNAMLAAADRIEWADSDVIGNYYNFWNAMLAAEQKGGQ